MKRNISFVLGAMVIIISAISSHAQTGADFKILRTIKVAGDGKWDYSAVDEQNQRLFISHGDQVQILDLKTEKVIGAIDSAHNVHGFAFAHDLNKGFFTNGATGTVTIFDLTTFSVIKVVKVTGDDPDNIVYDPLTKRVFTFNGDGKNSTVIDAKTGQVLNTIDLQGSPEAAVIDNTGNIYLNLGKENVVLRINTSTYKIEAKWSVSPGQGPTALGIDITNKRLFIGCRGNKGLSVTDATSGKIITTLPIGEKVDAICFDPETKNIFASNGDGTLNIFHEDTPDTYSTVQTVVTKPRSKTVALDLNTHLAYLSSADFTPDKKVVPGTFAILVVGK